MDMTADQIVQRFALLMKQATEVDDAAIFQSSVGVSQECRVITLDLSTAKSENDPFVVGFPFRSFYVASGTDNSVAANLRLATRDSYQDKLPLKNQSVMSLPYPTSKAFIDWSAQSGKTMTIVFLLRGQFSTNQTANILSGGVGITDGSQITTSAVGSVTTTAAVLLAQDLTRNTASIQNQGTIPIYVGDSGVTAKGGATPGQEIPAGGTLIYKNTAALYAITASGTNAAIAINVEK